MIIISIISKQNGGIVLWKVISDDKRKTLKIVVSGTINEGANCICRRISERFSLLLKFAKICFDTSNSDTYSNSDICSSNNSFYDDDPTVCYGRKLS